MLGSGLLRFKLHYDGTNNLAIGDAVSFHDVSAGGHLWRVYCYPRGQREEDKGKYVSIFLHLVSNSRDIKAMFHVFPLGRDGEPSLSNEKRFVHVYSSQGSENCGWTQFMERTDLEAHYIANGKVTCICGIIVVCDNTIAVPPSDIGCHLGLLLDCNVGTDVSFIVKGETIPAHRAVLAARSPVFKAELFGAAMAGTTSPSITLQGIEPATFRAMLGFMYTDELPEDHELGDSLVETMQHMLGDS